MFKGRVKFFNNQTGFGIIEGSGRKNIVVNYSVIQSKGLKTLYEGQNVSFDIQDSERGLSAINVKIS